MTDNLLYYIRPLTLAQMAAEIVIDHAEDVSYNADYAFNFRSESVKNVYAEVVGAGIANAGVDDFFQMLHEAISREWDAWNDRELN